MSEKQKLQISFFDKYLTVWVVLCMAAGVLIGRFLPGIPAYLGRFEYARVSIPIAVLIWVMIWPMMMKVDFASIKNVGRSPKGLFVTWIVNWLIKPFTMFGIAAFFFYVVFKNLIPPELAKDYLAGAILLGAAPCTAMVFVWSHLTRGNPAYTVVQVATNDLIILVAFVPIVALLLGVGGIQVPWNTLFISVGLFVVIPLAGGMLTRLHVIKSKGLDYFNQSFLPKFGNVTIGGLLLTLVLIFSFQGDVILNNPLHIVLIAVPLIIQTYLIFFIAYLAGKKLCLPHDIAAPGGMIGASNFFELSVAVAISLFGASSPVVLATIVGVLVEVPVMLSLVKFANRTTKWFPAARSMQYRQQNTGDLFMTSQNKDAIRKMVRERYAGVAASGKSGCGCSSSSCCTPKAPTAKEQSAKLGYSKKELDAVPEGADMGLGCGNPQAIAGLKKGEVVLDLGAGGGFDCFLAAKQVGSRGRVIGVDMTPEMVAKARENARKGKFRNVEFRLGEIEHMPVADGSVDIIMSNCVINLSPDKEQVYREAFRVLKPGGRLAISDVVAIKPIPAAVRDDFDKHSGCVSGALLVRKLERILLAAGFSNICLAVKEQSAEFIKDWFPGSGIERYVRSANVQATKPKGKKR